MVFSFETHHSVFIVVQTSDNVISCRYTWPLAALNEFFMAVSEYMVEFILMKGVRKIKHTYFCLMRRSTCLRSTVCHIVVKATAGIASQVRVKFVLFFDLSEETMQAT